MKKYRIANPKRFAIACTAAGAALFASIGLMAADANQVQHTYATVTVEPGDTLWDLVQEYNPDYKGDVRKLVHVASKHNGGSSLMAYDTVLIPVANQ